MKRWMIRIGVLIVVIAIAYGARVYMINKEEDKVIAQLQQIIAGLPSYDLEQAYIDQLFERSHRVAFNRAISTQLSKGKTEFDDQKYLDELFRLMSSSAEAAGKKELAQELEALKLTVGVVGK